MAKRDSLGMQFRATIGKKVMFVARTKMLSLLHNAAVNICDSFDEYAMMQGMNNITGNARRSFTIGIYEDRNLVDIVTTSGKDPTMRTLREGQAYPLPAYYDGGSADAQGRYVGTFGHGGQWGPTLGKYRIRGMKPKSRAKWQMLVICPVEYAAWDANNHIHIVMSAISQDLSEWLYASVAYVKRTDHVKTISTYSKYT